MKRLVTRGIGLLLFTGIILSTPELVHRNSGESESIGSVRDGKLQNAYLLPWSGPNFSYFSALSYFILNYGYVHSTVYNIILEAYETCETTRPRTDFRVMDCSRKRGGRMLIHWTHQNGLSADFMVVKERSGKQAKGLDRLGVLHYGLDFSETGKSLVAPKVSIDFETIATHILALDDAARNHNMRIRKIIFRVDLLDELYATPAGQEILERDIFMVPRLPKMVNRVHDDHYHVDFEFVP